MCSFDAIPRLTALTVKGLDVDLVAQDRSGLLRQLQDCTIEWVYCSGSTQTFIKQLEELREVRRRHVWLPGEYWPRWQISVTSSSGFVWQGTCFRSGTCVHCLIKQGLLPEAAQRPWRDMQASASW